MLQKELNEGMEKRGNGEMNSEKTAAVENAEVKGSGFLVEADPAFSNFQEVKVTKVDDSKPWKPPMEVEVAFPDGRKETMDAATPFFTLKSAVEGGKDLTVSAAVAGHVDSLHFKGEDAGSRFDYPSLESMLQDVAGKLPEKVATEPGVSAFDLEMGKHMGKEGLASADELLKDGAISSDEVLAVESERQTVYELNKTGSPEEKKAFVERFRAEHPDSSVQFDVIRGSVVAPVVDVPKRDTTKLFMVFGPNEKDPNRKTMWTAAPGRNMPPHPIPGQHMDKEGTLNEETFAESSKAWFDTMMLVGK